MSRPTPPSDSVKRFSDRVENYVRYRPGYPPGVLDRLLEEVSQEENLSVVDLASGTGKLSQVFIERGISVIGVEPNREMREAAERLFRGDPLFRSVDGTAEATGLPDRVASIITIGQALHWLSIAEARRECCRLLFPGGIVGVVYNERGTSSSLSQAYEDFLYRHANGYREVAHRNIDEAVFQGFFGAAGYESTAMENSQIFDFEGLLGRYLSSSYAYAEADQRFPKAVRALRDIFEAHQVRGKICFDYRTSVYAGRMI